MSSQSSLLKRVAVPLLALTAAAALCGSARAATATLVYYGYYGSGPYTLSEHVKLTIEDDSTWNKAVFYGQQLAQNGAAGSVEDDAVLHSGPGDYYDYGSFNQSNGSQFPAGTYNFWCICSGVDYYYNAWNASTGGTDYMNVPSP